MPRLTHEEQGIVYSEPADERRICFRDGTMTDPVAFDLPTRTFLTAASMGSDRDNPLGQSASAHLQLGLSKVKAFRFFSGGPAFAPSAESLGETEASSSIARDERRLQDEPYRGHLSKEDQGAGDGRALFLVKILYLLPMSHSTGVDLCRRDRTILTDNNHINTSKVSTTNLPRKILQVPSSLIPTLQIALTTLDNEDVFSSVFSSKSGVAGHADSSLLAKRYSAVDDSATLRRFGIERTDLRQTNAMPRESCDLGKGR